VGCAPAVLGIREKARLFILLAAMYGVFLLRFGLVDLSPFPALEVLTQAVASIILAIILYVGLGKITFTPKQKRSDELGDAPQDYSWLWNGMKQLMRLTLAIVPLLAVAGYTNLSLYLAFNLLVTLLAGMLFIGLRKLAIYLNHRFLHYGSEDEKDDEKKLSPLAITILEPILALLSLMITLFFWGMTTEDLTGWAERYRTGFTIGDMTINFSSIGAGLFLFFIIYLATRILQWFLSSRVFPHTQMSLGVREAVLVITGYAGVTIAFFSGISAFGFDLSNLAIVAGALSVGIGFGLQAIFSNFVSGLILLFERPVKVGDWIVVGDKQGIIKRISVRATEIETFWNSSVMVPNSQLISETVTNWTLHDRVGRVDVPVGVAYGSDTEKVKEVLLKVAKEHPQVRAIPSPNVYFMNFGDSSLDFELRCFIRNIRDVFSVSSELRFAIDKAFREHHIEIPFPQRDLHIRSGVPLTVETAENGSPTEQE
jgi:potassium efflux system protein